MELKSEPTYETVQVTDIDIQFPGDLQTYTLRDDRDSFISDQREVVISFAAGGSVTFYKVHAHWIAIRHRSIRVLVPEAQSGKSAAAPPPVSAG